MNSSPTKARVLVATDSLPDGDQLLGLLQEHFEQVNLSTLPDQGARDFETHRPDVLVLAFNTVAKAQGYYLGLYRAAESLNQHPHRTVLLCSKDEVLTAFDLCKKQYFDDYVLYWPLAYDGLRLPMSVWSACREITVSRAQVPERADLLGHVKRLGELEQTLRSELSSGEHRIAAAHDCLMRLERDLATSTDNFSRYLMEEEAAGAIEVKDGIALGREIARLKDQQIGQARAARERGIEPMNAWAEQFKDRVEPALEGTRVLADSVRSMRARLMVVDDDAMTRDVLSRALRDGPYEITFAEDGIEALRQLRHARPDVILMDIRLPGLDGISLTRRLKASPQLMSIPIIMMTGDSRRETVNESMDAGAADFVVKPFTRESLRLKLDKVMPR